MPRKDMTQAEFDAACKRRGFETQGFGGYFRLDTLATRVSAWNAGTNRRAQLAYLIQEHARHAEREERERIKWAVRKSMVEMFDRLIPIGIVG